MRMYKSLALMQRNHVLNFGIHYNKDMIYFSAQILTTREVAWYIISVVSVCVSDDNFRKP